MHKITSVNDIKTAEDLYSVYQAAMAAVNNEVETGSPLDCLHELLASINNSEEDEDLLDACHHIFENGGLHRYGGGDSVEVAVYEREDGSRYARWGYGRDCTGFSCSLETLLESLLAPGVPDWCDEDYIMVKNIWNQWVTKISLQPRENWNNC